MKSLDDENKFEKVKGLLKNLKKINAPSNFETELYRKINQADQKSEKESWFDKIFSPKIIPSAALAVTTVIILFLLKGNVNNGEDPFQLIPKLREEQIIDKKENLRVEIKDETRSQKDLKSGDSNVTFASSYDAASLDRISVTTTNYLPNQAVIMSGGLNFKVIRIDSEERKQIEMLRQKMNNGSEYQQNN